MIKLITPLGMLFTVSMMALFAVYLFWTAYLQNSWLYCVLGLVAIVASVGAAMLRAWSQYLIYFLTFAFMAAWCYSVYAGAAVGYFNFFFSSKLLAARALAPGFALMALSGAASWIAFRHFRRARQKA